MIFSKGDLLECNKRLTVNNTDGTRNVINKGDMFIVTRIIGAHVEDNIYLFNSQTDKTCVWIAKMLVSDIKEQYFIHHPL